MRTFRRLISICCAVLMLALPFVHAAGVTITAEAGTVDTASKTAVVTLSLAGNTGLAGALISVKYDSALKLTKIESGDALSSLTFTPGGDLAANPVNLLWDGQDADASNGKIAVLTFSMPERAGEYSVSLSGDAGNFFDNDMNDVAVALNGCSIRVEGTLPETTQPTTPATDPVNDNTQQETKTDPSANENGVDTQKTDVAQQPAQGGDTPSVDAPEFRDVAASAWYHDAVAYVAQKGLMSGTTSSTFSPESPMTRAMLMTVLARYAGTDTSGGATWYEKGMLWAKENGISDGSNPSGNITREQLATMLYRYAQKQGKGFTGAWAFPLNYPDSASVSDWAYESLCWMTMNKVINGMGDGTLNPKGSATRAQVATMLMRFLELN